VVSEVAQLEPLERAIQERVERNTLRVPPYPAVAVRVQEALGRKDAGLAEVAELVGADAVLAAAILRCANSVMYRRGPPVTDLVQGITRIGAAEVLRLLLASGLSTGAQAVGPLVSIRRLIWIEGLASAAVCQELARVRGLRTEEAFVLGLLHDFGKIVASSAMEALLEEGRFDGRFPLAAWAAVVDRQHVAVGMATAAAWNLPSLVGEVIAGHHAAPGAVRCKDPGLLEVVKLADQVVALLLTRSRVTAADLARLDGLAADERAGVERVIENVPEFVSAFETPAATAFVGSPRVALPETTFRGAGRKVSKLGVSVSVSRRPRLFQVSEVSPDGLVMSGEEPLPEDRLLEAKVYAQEPFTMWALIRLCGRVPGGFRVELAPFALSGAAKEAWEKMVAGG
jgi:HD-like signal output (HDOD) protein